MKITLKQYADYFAVALEIDLLIKNEIITWADSLILKYPQPSMWMIDLSTSQNTSIQDTIDLLKKIEGDQGSASFTDRDLNISFQLLVAKISILYPSIKYVNYQILSNLGYWYRMNQEKIRFNLPFMYSFEVPYFLDESKSPEYYRELITIGKDYISYLPNTK